jgi:high-affinity K+ transport system ATPase subunit B
MTDGLTAAEAARRLAEQGPNAIPEPKPDPIVAAIQAAAPLGAPATLLSELRGLGVKTVMVTGDAAATAKAVARSIGLEWIPTATDVAKSAAGMVLTEPAWAASSAVSRKAGRPSNAS